MGRSAAAAAEGNRENAGPWERAAGGRSAAHSPFDRSAATAVIGDAMRRTKEDQGRLPARPRPGRGRPFIVHVLRAIEEC